MKIRRNIGKYLKKIREEKRLSLNEVVALLGIYKINTSHSTLSRIEHGHMLPRTDMLAGLSIIYEISSEEILFYSK
jgi:transcriptional regulator with XRE-family HTH domain